MAGPQTNSGLFSVLTRMLESIITYFVMAILLFIVFAGKVYNHFPPSKTEVAELFDKMSRTMQKSEDSLAELGKVSTQLAELGPQLSVITQKNQDLENRMANIEAEIASLKAHQR